MSAASGADAAPAPSPVSFRVPSFSSSETAYATLPEAPDPQFVQLKRVNPATAGEAPLTPARSKYIPSGWKAQQLDYAGKVKMGATDLYSIGSIGSIFLSAGYEQLTNGEPNYGTDKGAFGQRLGASAIRGTSQDIFTDMVFAPLLHEDSRYYQLGPSHSFFRRTTYAITRPLVTRTDTGHQTVNGGLLLGYAAAAALTPTYYPQINRNFHDTASTYLGSIGGAALGSFITEFTDGIFRTLHLRRGE